MFPASRLRIPRQRYPMDERLPDGRTITEALAQATGDWSYPVNPASAVFEPAIRTPATDPAVFEPPIRRPATDLAVFEPAIRRAQPGIGGTGLRGAGPVPLGGDPIGAPPLRTDEFAPYTGAVPTGTFAGDAPPVMSTVRPAIPAAPAPRLPVMGQPAVPEPAIPEARPPIYSGERTEGMSRLQSLMAKRRVLTDPLNADREVFQSAEGWESAPGEKSPSRLKQALIGLLQGAAAGAQGPTEGAAWRALGGAATGAAAGGISPRLMKALTRQQEVDRTTGDIQAEMGMELGNARIEETLAQAEQRRREPELREAALQRQLDNDAAMEEDREERRQLTRERNEQRVKEFETRTKERDAALKIQLKRLDTQDKQFRERMDETKRANKAREGRPTRNITAENDEKRLREAREAAIAAESLYKKGHDYWEQAKAKRAEADKLSATPSSRVQNKERIRQLLREAEGLEDQTRKVQEKGDEERAKAAAKGDEGEAASSSDTSGGTFNYSGWLEAHPNATEEQKEAVKAKARARKMAIR